MSMLLLIGKIIISVGLVVDSIIEETIRSKKKKERKKDL